MITVAVSGASGRMGSLVCSTIDAADDLELTAAIDPAGAGQSVCDVAVVASAADAGVPDVVVEFTHPDVVMENLAHWAGTGASVVVGTSGFDTHRLAELQKLWTGTGRCLVVPNFSVGAVLMMRMSELAASFFPRAEIVELHHDQKADAPSGTSLATAARMAAARSETPSPVGTEIVQGARGADADSVPIHSVRLGGLVAHQEVLFGGDGETLTIRHDSLDRSSFMPGVLAAVRGVQALPEPVTVGLDSILGI